LRNLLFAVNWEHKSFSHNQTQKHTRETSEAESKMQTHSLFLIKEERESSLEEVLIKT